jgi:hypothetical protein
MGLELGDVVAPSRDNSWVVFDRRTKAVKRVVKPGFDARWVHDMTPPRPLKGGVSNLWVSGVSPPVGV